VAQGGAGLYTRFRGQVHAGWNSKDKGGAVNRRQGKR